jgi:hypothetical protein
MKIKELQNCLKKLSIEELREIYSFIDNILEPKELGNIPIGETFEFDGEEYLVIGVKTNLVNPCAECAFCGSDYDEGCKFLYCDSVRRDDNQSVVFIKK